MTRPSASEDVAVHAKNVGMVYNGDLPQAVVALDDVNLEVRDEEFVSLLGPSGCGKSTLLKIIAGLLTPTSGTVEMRATEGTGQRKIGMVFQSPVLLPWRTVLSNVLLPAEVEGRRSQSRERAMDLLDMAGLTDFADRYPYHLSGGMQQRVALVRALLPNPEVLLMDEPFGALDAMTRDQMNLELLRVWQKDKKTVIFVTHSIQEAVFLSDRVVMMSARPGRVSQTFDVGIDRPRTVDMMSHTDFAELTAEIRKCLLGEDAR